MSQGNRVAVYYVKHYTTQNTDHQPYGEYISPLPLKPYATHLMIGAIHLSELPGIPPITIDDDAYDSDIYKQMWEDAATLQSSGVKVMGMMGGAISPASRKGDFELLFSDWDTYYPLLKAMIRETKLQGLDLDCEEGYKLPNRKEASAALLKNTEKLITALRNDFGPDLIITLAPVADDLQSTTATDGFSGFDYNQLEKDIGNEISFYNVQFYNGWGNLSVESYNDLVNQKLFTPLKLTAGALTNPENGGSGFVPVESGPVSQVSIAQELTKQYGAQFGGMIGWEYFNSQPGGELQPQIWAQLLQKAMEC